MTTATPALDDLGETIAAAMRDLYDQLRAIVDRGPTDDPSILDEIGALTGRIRRRITSARKKAEPAAEPTGPKPAAPGQPRESSPLQGQPLSSTRTSSPTPPSTTPGGQVKATASADAPTVPRHRAVPAPRRSGEYTVRLPQTQPRTGGRHRIATVRLPWWVHALVIMLMVAGVAIGLAVTPSGFAALPASVVLLGAAHRLHLRRRASTGSGR